jgi:glycosyltransferase involved in cell wall biosynthesis
MTFCPAQSNRAWPLAVFAHNEGERITVCLNSLEAAAAGHPLDVFVLVNGCTDDTEQRVLEIASRNPWVHLVPIALADKADAWNTYVHGHLPPDAEFSFFMDGDVTAESGAFPALLDALARAPEAHVAAAVPRNGRNREDFEKQIVEEHGVAGNLYCIRGAFLNRLRTLAVRMPIGLIGDDGWVAAFAKWDLNPQGTWDNARVEPCPEAGFIFEQIPVSWKGAVKYWRRMKRYSLRQYQNRMLGVVVKRGGLSALPREVDQLYLEAAEHCRLKWNGVSTLSDIVALRHIRERRQALQGERPSQA